MSSHFLMRTWMMVMAALLLSVAPSGTYAQTGGAVTPGVTGGGAQQSQVCTNFSNRKNEIFGGTFSANGGTTAPQNEPGLLTEIDGYIKDVVGTATYKLFSAFTNNVNYRNAVFAAMVLMVIFYGVGFTIGVVQASFGQLLIRMVKISIVATLVSPAGWTFFSDYVVRFFSDGTDDIIRSMMEIGTGAAVPQGASVFYQLDNLTKFLINPESIIAIMGSAVTGGPFGLTMSAMLLLSFWTFLKLILQAVQTYAICYVARALILGVAPIFFVFMLFSQTMNYFKSWVNTLLNLSLQPILLFTFLSFFIVLIESASADMLGFELCWSETQLIEGSENRMSFWTFVKPGTTEPISKGDMTWHGALGCLAEKDAKQCPPFPIDILDILTFLILVYLAERFISVLQTMASELSNAFINVDAGGKFQEFVERAGRGEATPSSVQASGAQSNSSGGNASQTSGGARRNNGGNDDNAGSSSGGGGGGGGGGRTSSRGGAGGGDSQSDNKVNKRAAAIDKAKGTPDGERLEELLNKPNRTPKEEDEIEDLVNTINR